MLTQNGFVWPFFIHVPHGEDMYIDEAVESPSLKGFKRRIDEVLRDMG